MFMFGRSAFPETQARAFPDINSESQSNAFTHILFCSLVSVVELQLARTGDLALLQIKARSVAKRVKHTFRASILPVE